MYAKGSLDALILTVGGRLRRSRRWWKNSAIFVYRMLPLKVWCSASSSIFWTSLLIDCKKPGLMCVTCFVNCLMFRSLYYNRFAVWKERCHPKLEMPPSNTLVRFTTFVYSDINADSPSTVNNIDVTVFLVSLKAGGVALNLTEASRVYLMDSWWNPAVSTLPALHVSFLKNDFNCRLNIVCFVSPKDEPNLNLFTEAMDRIHRLGQRRPVQAIKLVVEDSIESRIVQASFIPVLTDNRC